MNGATGEVVLHDRLEPTDRAVLRAIAESSGYFREEELDVVRWLVDERLEKGDASGYFFLLADAGGERVGFAIFGPISGCEQRHDLYWIAVREDQRGKGLGARLLRRSEEAIAATGGRRIYVDTSSRPDYAPTRRFYEKHGYRVAAELPDFYRRGDGKTIYLKVLRDDPA